MLALPLLLLVAVEAVLRLFWQGGALPLFTTVNADAGAFRVANPRVGERWFFGEEHPPSPIADPFAITRPPKTLRFFVLGESTTAGFPFPRNVTFSRLLRDVLRDVLPADSIEVVNMGVAATNSFTMLDMADEIIAQRPSAVLIYAGHNEYYGAFGAASRQGGVGGPRLARATLWLEHSRVVMALRRGIEWTRRRFAGRDTSSAHAASFMETLARDQSIALGDATYDRGVRQFDDNLHALLTRFRDAGVPVFIGSLTSNVRDQAPFVSAVNDRPGGARAVYADAERALAAGDTTHARQLFTRARDLDVVRFRAPSAFNDVIRRTAASSGAVYVPVAEVFERASPAGIPGHELFLEHVHPTRRGYVLLAQSFFDALRSDRRFGGAMQQDRLRSWDAYDAGMDLTPFDERVAEHMLHTLQSRWPFVSARDQRDYRATYRPTGLLDSLAFDVSRGATWSTAKLDLARDYERRGFPDSAAAEYRGLARDAPIFAEPWRLLGQALLESKRPAEAEAPLSRAFALRPTAPLAKTLGMLALDRRDLQAGANYLQRSLALDPTQPPVLYQLSLTYGLLRDLPNARRMAIRLARLDPAYPGLAGWMATLGLSR